jgi:hypothetical protein
MRLIESMMSSSKKWMKVLARESVAIALGALVAVGVAGGAPLAAETSAAQTAQALPHEAGTVKSASGDGFVLTTAAGQDVSVAVPAGAKVLIVPPGSKNLSAATAGSAADVQPGDRALVTGTQGDTANVLHAERVILMKGTAIAETHEAEEAAWAKGGGGIVKSVDAAEGRITISSGLRTVTITTQPATILRRYAGDSVRFADARPSTITEIHSGDQIRVRGTRSADGSTIAADEIVTGTFRHYSGLLTAVDQAAGTVTLKDLATHRVVTVEVTPNSDVRRLPPMAARMIAMRMHGGAGANERAGSGAARPEGAGAHGEAGDASGTRRAGMDLSQMLSRLPAESLAGLKKGDAVMIVATSPSEESEHNSAVTLLVGVEPILTAPSGESMTLSPWSVGSEPDAGMGGSEGGSGPGK